MIFVVTSLVSFGCTTLTSVRGGLRPVCRRPLLRGAPSPTEIREAADDIDEEVTRLNRVVNDVLDFARPLHFDLAPTDVNRVCEESAAAASTDGASPAVHLDLDPSLGVVNTDGERLRSALVNILVNARHAVAARRAGDGTEPVATGVLSDAERTAGRSVAGGTTGTAGRRRTASRRQLERDSRVGVPLEAGGAASDHDVVLQTALLPGGRFSIVVRDRGVGIEQADLARVFEPYFTTKRAGTGLGLAISRNIVKGLGGSIAVSSQQGHGTEIRLELPMDSSREERTP